MAGPELAPAEAGRLRLIQRATLGLLLVLVAGLGFRQLYRGADYATRERRQNLRRVMVPGLRGVIYDREHRVLAGNRTHLAVGLNLGRLHDEFAEEQRTLLAREGAAGANPGPVHPAEGAAPARLAVVQRQLDRVNALTGRRAQVDAAQLERHFAREPRSLFVLADDLTAKEAAALDAKLEKSGPLQLQRTSQRWYPQRNAAAHVLGRVRRDRMRPDASLASHDLAALSYLDTIGDSGIEKQYDSRLRGRPGSAIVRVDAWGALLDPPLEHHDPDPGEDLVLSLDLDLQLAAERTMDATPGGPRGAAVVIAVASGEVLALASKPDFDLNAVSPTLAPATKQQIDAEGGWLNRASQGLYPPGSSFKIFTALAGLRRGTLRPDDVVRCAGFYEVAGHRFPCHYAAGHGDLKLRTALAQSCNVFAYRTGLAAGADALVSEARRFHFGEPTGIDLPAETRRMLVPDPAWKQADGRGGWTAGDTANFSIGQGFLRYSPLQAACAIASLARRETLTVPTLLHQPGRHPSGDRPPEPLGLAERDYAALIDGMQAVILIGIGRDAQVPGVSMAGKSGTAQVRRKDGMTNIAWFVAFAPVERPEIAVAVALEGDRPGEEFAGAAHAAPVVREIVGAWSDKRARR
jgi:penicillin-binding protein 2